MGDVYGVPFERCTDAVLLKEYTEMQKASFNAMFGHNAEKQRKAVGAELIRRGITAIPNIFGDIAIRV